VYCDESREQLSVRGGYATGERIAGAWHLVEEGASTSYFKAGRGVGKETRTSAECLHYMEL
jgi:hypothetical protein